MKLVVLGHGDTTAAPDTAGCIAVGEDGGPWVLVNAAPDLAHHLESTTALRPIAGRVADALRGVVLLDAQVEHVTGLLSLRDGPPLHVYATPSVFDHLGSSLPVLQALEPYCGVRWHLLPVAGDTQEAGFQVDGLPHLRFTALSLDGATPGPVLRPRAPAVGDLIALFIEDLASGQSVFVSPALPRVGERERAWMARADCLLVDGRPFGDGPLPAPATDWLARLAAPRKVLFPDPRRDAAVDARRQAHQRFASRGIELAHDGMEIVL